MHYPEQLIADALDILKFDGDIIDTLSELRKKWGRQVPELLDNRFDVLCSQYLQLSHEKGAAALGQELSACGWALYDLDGEDIYLFVLLPGTERDTFEQFCRRQKQYCRLMKQPGRKWGQAAKAEKSQPVMPCAEYNLSGMAQVKVFLVQSIAGDFASGYWKENGAENWQGECIFDFRSRPPRVMRLTRPSHFGFLCYSAEQDLYAAVCTSDNGTAKNVIVGKDPRFPDEWGKACSIDYHGALQVVWLGNHLCVGDSENATIFTLENGRFQKAQNYRMPCGERPYRFAIDGLGRVYFTNGHSRSTVYRWDNGKVDCHHFHMEEYDDLAQSLPVPGASRIWMLRETSGNPREKNILDLDMDTGRCKIANLPNMGEDPTMRRFTGDWVLIQGNGEDLKLDFAQLWNQQTGEILRIRPGMFGSEKLGHIAALRDGTVILTTLRWGEGQVIHFPANFWEFLQTANRPKKLERWREYREVYPNLSDCLPPKAPENKIVLKKDSLTILDMVFTPPFVLEHLVEKLGPARIALQNVVRKDPVTGRESPYPQALALWDSLGLQGWLQPDEHTICTVGIRVAPQGDYAVRYEFDGTLQIGSRDYRHAKWEAFGSFAHTLNIGGFTVFTRLPSASPADTQPELKKRMESLSAMVKITWKDPAKQDEKAQKYKLQKPEEPVLKFDNFNFKLAVIEVLMYEKNLLEPKLNAYEFARAYRRRKIDIDAEGYAPIPEIRDWLEKLPIPARLAPQVTEIEMDGGSEIYTQLCPFWDGEDEIFDLNAVTEAELKQFPHLEQITLMSSQPEKVVPVLKACGLKVKLL